ncbi:ADP-ribosylation factor GTPase activating protein, ER-Golgi transport [Xylographa trunciseda]|nr:ADP-ribosylation factor GTPase activating protein, ER-Golgi transport [Xylographa trunciseda]
MAGFCAGTSVPDCNADYTLITPDPDIEGIGVVVSFLVSAGLTLVTALIGLVLQQLPTKPPKNKKVPSGKGGAKLRDRIRRKLEIHRESRDYIETIIERFVLGLADVQLLTGTSMLLVAFLKCDITTYHFSIIIDLVWFSSNSHLTAMLILNDYLMEYHAARFWRVILMGAMCLLLMVATILETNQLWYDQLPTPVRCTFLDTGGNMKGSIVGYTVLTFILLVYGYSITIFPLFSPVNNRMENLSMKFEKWVEAHVKPDKKKLRTHSRFRTLVTEIGCRCIYGFWQISMYFNYINFLFDLVWFGLGVLFLFQDIAAGQSYMDNSSSSIQSWGFGQLIPMFLLSIPILTVSEIFYEETKEFKARKQSKADAADAADVKLHLKSTAASTDPAHNGTRNNTGHGEHTPRDQGAGRLLGSESDDERFEPPSRQDSEQRVAGIEIPLQAFRPPTLPRALAASGNRPFLGRSHNSFGSRPKKDAPGPRPVLATLAESSSAPFHDGGQSSNFEPPSTLPERRSTFTA